MSNIRNCSDLFRIAIRIKVDNENINSLPLLFKLLGNELNSEHIGCYCEAVGPTTHYSTPCIKRVDYDRQILKVYGAMLDSGLDPLIDVWIRDTYCVADSLNSIVIGPDGNCYKCWTDVDSLETRHRMCIGTTLNYHQWHTGFIAKWLSNDPFADEMCSQCTLLPICLGGCPRSRVFNHIRYCPAVKGWNLDDYIFLLARKPEKLNRPRLT